MLAVSRPRWSRSGAVHDQSTYSPVSDVVVLTMVRRGHPMLQAKPISPASGRPMSDPAREDAVPSAPAMTEESASRTAPPPTPGMGGRTAPAPPSQPLDGGAGAVGFLGGAEAGVGGASDQGAEVEKEVGSWRGRLTARDRELVGHLGLVRYLRTNQIAEMMFRGRAQSVLSARLGELADRHGAVKTSLTVRIRVRC